MGAAGVADVEADWFAYSGGWAPIETSLLRLYEHRLREVVGSVLTLGRNGVNCDGSAVQGLQMRHGFKTEHCYVCGIQPSGFAYQALGVSTGGIEREGSLALSASRADQVHA